MKDNTKIAQLNKFLFDVRAEVAVAHWFEKAFINEKQLFVKFDGQHERGVGKDIKKLHHVEGKVGVYDKLIDLTLNRDSIYDTLPEVLFHLPRKRTRTTGADTMAEDYRTRKVEERTARTFFNPFDQVLFFQKAFIEQQESKITDDLNQFIVEDEFYDFLFIDSNLPSFLKVRLLCFLPYIDKIVGNFDLTRQCLALLIDHDVSFGYYRKTLFSDEYKRKKLGSDTLGRDFIVGNTVETFNQNVEFEIGPIPKSDLLFFLHEGYMVRLFEVFGNYFMPLEVEALFKIRVKHPENEFQLKPISSCDSRLNYTTFI